MKIFGRNIDFGAKSVINSDEIMGKSSGFVLANEPFSLILHALPMPRLYNPWLMWEYFRKNPEVNAVLSAIVEDILSDGWIIEGGKNKRRRAEKFLLENHAKEVFRSVLFDMLITGEGFIYKVINKNNSSGEIKTLIEQKLRDYGINDSTYTDRLYDEFRHESDDTMTTRKFIEVPTTSMHIRFDKHGNAIEYIQRAMGNIGTPVTFDPNEIIHFRLMKMDGKVHGYTPLSSLITIMETLQDMRDYTRYYWNQGGVPNWLILFKGESPDSPNVKAFKKAMQQYTNVQNKYKSLVGTVGADGIEMHPMNSEERDMQFRELATYLTKVIVMVWGVPAKRLSDLLVQKGAKAGQTDQGYYRKISHMQDIFEDYINLYLIKEFDVTMHFNKTYKQDEVVEAQADLFKTNVAQLRLNLNIWDREHAAKYLGVPIDELPPEIEMVVGKPPQQGFAKDKQNLATSQDEVNANQLRQQTQLENVAAKATDLAYEKAKNHVTDE